MAATVFFAAWTSCILRESGSRAGDGSSDLCSRNCTVNSNFFESDLSTLSRSLRSKRTLLLWPRKAVFSHTENRCAFLWIVESYTAICMSHSKRGSASCAWKSTVTSSFVTWIATPWA